MTRWNPQQYEQTIQIRIRAFQDLLAWAQQNSLADQAILDIGCGTGAIDDFIVNQHKNSHVTGIDLSTDMIHFASAHYQHPRLSFSTLNACEMNFNNTFDTVISLACLHWVKEQDLLLKKVYQALKPNGQALFVIYPRPLYLFESLKTVTAIPEWQSYFIDFDHGYHDYNAENYQRLAESADFTVNKIEMIHSKYNLTKDNYKKLVASWLPHLKVIPREDHARFMDSLAKEVLKHMKAAGENGFNECSGLTLMVYLKKNQTYLFDNMP